MSGKRQENLLAKIAALLEKPVEEIKEARSLYTEEEAAYEAQSVLNFYEWRKKLVRDSKEPDHIWEARKRVWQYKTCESCQELFAYSYHYDGVKYCSLDCLSVALKKIGLQVKYGRPLNLRWGLKYPGIVPSSALKSVESALSASCESEHENDETDLPKSHSTIHSETDSSTASLPQDMLV